MKKPIIVSVKALVTGILALIITAGTAYGGERGFTPQTEKVVEEHMADFNYASFESFMDSHGGAEEYVRSLGGIFEKWCGVQGTRQNVRSAKDFQEIAEYVMGIMTIWGPDYHGGAGDIPFNDKNGEYGRFYAGQDAGHSWKLAPLEEVYFQNREKIVTDCGCGVYYILQKAGMHDSYAGENDLDDAEKRIDTNHGGKLIDRVEDLQIGDVIQMSKTSEPSGWGHVCIVAEVHPDGTVITYDTGSRFAETGCCKCVFEADEDGDLKGDYNEYESWFGMRFRQLDQSEQLLF